jgi:preprotein translocase SecE subunit
VARDRQRAKQRRRRREAGGGKPPSSRSSRAGRGVAGDEGRRPEADGLDDPSIEESGLGEATPAPDPLKNATPDVDQARAAETGAYREGPGEPVEPADELEFDEDDYTPAPDEVEGDLVPATGARGPVDPAVAEELAEEREPRRRGRVLTFLGHCVDELRRVQWPNRRQVGQATAVVLGFVVLAGGFLGLMDAIWRPVMDAIL